MKTFFGFRSIKKFTRPVVALGVFDGVHLGHRRVLKATLDKARRIKGESVAVTFWPHPQKKEGIFSLKHRLLLLKEMGIDDAVVIKFTGSFSNIRAEEFIKSILVKKIGAAYIYTGENFRFGRNASGNPKLLKRLSKKYSFNARALKVYRSCAKPVSSTLIRHLVKKGNLKRAQELLGHPVSVLGSVIRGTRLGRIIGFPTANINPHHELIPPTGIYAVRIKINGRIYKGACYIGRKPTVFASRKGKVWIEVYILNFSKNIYGEYLEINFVKKLRPDKKFSNLASLSNQIRKDIACAKRILS